MTSPDDMSYNSDMVSKTIALTCAKCGHTHALASLAWRCAKCGGVLDLSGFAPEPPSLDALAGRPATLWRYSEALPVAEPAGITLGEGMTPLVTTTRPGTLAKLDYLAPTGSFKDRGAVMLLALAKELGVSRVLADSSGNAGAAVAAYAARAGIACDIYVPASTSPGKFGQLRAFGAKVVAVEGSRADTADAAAKAADAPDVFYASHVYHPFFVQGTKTYAYEIWEQLGGRLPGTLVLPVGNGTLVLGAYLGCRDLLARGLIERLPRIVAVQAAACAPLAEAFAQDAVDLADVATVAGEPTAAEGIAIATPARGAQILAAVRETGGTFAVVPEASIAAAHAGLAREGLYVEPTSAVCWAALEGGLVKDTEDTVVPMCGSGLKSYPPSISS